MNLIKAMLRIRAIEREIARRYPEGRMRTPIHLSIGQEAPAVALCANLNKDDLMVSTHRSHAHYLAKGGDLNALIAELYGKATGCSGGHGGSMHLVDRKCGFAGSTSIVGGSIAVGVGLAWAKRLRNEPGIVAVCFGDAAAEEGVLHESMNFASLHKLPVLFFCENNKFSCYTEIKERQPQRNITDLAKAHWMRSAYLCHTQVENLYISLNSIKMALQNGPYFVEVETWRHLEHCGPNEDDHLGYRSPYEVKEWLCKDEIGDMDLSEFTAEIEAAFRFAERSPDARPMGFYAG